MTLRDHFVATFLRRFRGFIEAPTGPLSAQDRSGLYADDAITSVKEWLGSDEALMVLINHQRRDIRSCACGWAELGQLHARHIFERLIAALDRKEPTDA